MSQVIPTHGNTPKSACLTKSSAAEIVAHNWTKVFYEVLEAEILRITSAITNHVNSLKTSGELHSPTTPHRVKWASFQR